MHFLRTLFWVLVTIVVVVFTMHNWQPVTVNLFGGLQADVKLPVLVSIAFLIGWLPTYAWHRARLWRARRAASVAAVAIHPSTPMAPSAASPAAQIDAIPPAADTF